MSTLEHRRLLVKVARLYHEQALNQQQIAGRLRLSRQKVQRLLHQAVDEGVVRISVNPLMGIFPDLEHCLEDQFGLVEAVIVETTAHEHPPTIAREVGAASADYLLRVLRPGDRLVIGWGNSLLGMASALRHLTRVYDPPITVIQGLGGIGDPNDEFHGTQLVRTTARALNARPLLLPAPGVAGSPEARDAFYADPQVAGVLATARTADVALTGIGSLQAETIRVPEFWKLMSPATMEELTSRGAVGSINLRYYDSLGRTVHSQLDRCTVGLTLAELQKIPLVVGVAGGAQKLSAIRSALEGRLIRVLVTDHITAERLIENTAAGRRLRRTAAR